jgi:hypothetical protein
MHTHTHIQTHAQTNTHTFTHTRTQALDPSAPPLDFVLDGFGLDNALGFLGGAVLDGEDARQVCQPISLEARTNAPNRMSTLACQIRTNQTLGRKGFGVVVMHGRLS